MLAVFKGHSILMKVVTGVPGNTLNMNCTSYNMEGEINIQALWAFFPAKNVISLRNSKGE